MPFTRLKAMLIGILLLVSGIALIVGDIVIPDFLWGASLGGIGVVLAPFGLIFLGVLMILASLVDTKGKHTRAPLPASTDATSQPFSVAPPPYQAQPPPPLPTYPCPNCGQPLAYNPEYQKWYCNNCKEYT